MSFDSFEGIIRFAIEKEIEAADFYEEASRQETYSDAKSAFAEFAKEEKKHRALLEGFLKGEKKLSGYEFKWVPDIKRSNYLIDLEYKKGMNYADLLRLAMKREEKALKLYNDMAEKAQGEDIKKILKMLSQEEAKHKLKLETLYDDHMAKIGD
ncbi:MAG: ferritin family protein [Pseudomonadota bacterium]